MCEIQERLGFYFVVNKIQAVSPFGRERLLFFPMLQSINELKKEFDRIANANTGQSDNLERVRHNLSRYKDIRAVLRKCKDDVPLNIVELFEMKNWCLIWEEMNESLLGIDGGQHFMMFPVEQVLEILDPEGVREPSFYIDNHFSSDIDLIRARKRALDRQFEELNNDENSYLDKTRALLLQEESAAERAACLRLSKSLAPYCEGMLSACDYIGELDLLLCKVKLLREEPHAILPSIMEQPSIRLDGMVNEEVAKGQGFTPISITLDYGLALLTGGNMGGKSVAMKTLGLNVMLAMCGWPVFAQKAELPFVSEIMYVGGMTSGEAKGFSLFGKEMYELIQITKSIKENALILIDEPARGTNPEEGTAIVKGLAAFLAAQRSFSVVVTHYDSIAAVANKHYRTYGFHDIDKLEKEIESMSEYTPEIFQRYMKYGIYLSHDKTVPREAIRVCQLLGLAPEIVSAIKGYLK